MSGTWKTKARGVRVPDPRWDTFTAINKALGITNAAVINQAIEDHNMRNFGVLSEVTYQVNVSRDGDWYMISVPEIDGLTQARKKKEVVKMARDLIAITLDIEPDSFAMKIDEEEEKS